MEISKLLCDNFVQPQIGYVYATKSSAFPDCIKIGKAADLVKRLSSLNTSCAPAPHNLVAAAATFDNTRDEKVAHMFFADARREGEFFELSEDVVKDYFRMHITAQHELEKSRLQLLPGFASEDAYLSPGVVVPIKIQHGLCMESLVLYRFLSSLVKASVPECFTANDLYQFYLKFSAGTSSRSMTVSGFGIALHDIEGVYKKRVACGMKYNINKEELKTFLQGIGRYDPLVD